MSGIVRDPSGVPVSGARVRWIGWNGKGLASLSEVRSGIDGGFRFDAADQRIQRGGALICDTQTGAVGISTRRFWGNGRSAFASVMEGVQLEVPFIAPDGKPIVDLPIVVERHVPTLGWLPETTKRTDGRGILASGPYEAGGFVRLRVPERFTQPIRLDLLGVGTEPTKRLRPVRLMDAGTVVGRIVDANGRPVAGVAVHAEPGEVGFAGGGDAPPAAGRRVRTDARGTYVFSGLPPSPHRICVDAAHEEAAKGWLPACVNVAPRAGQRSSTESLVLRRGGMIAGRCVQRSNGEPVGGVTVWVIPPGTKPPVVEPLTSSSVFNGTRRATGAGTRLKPLATPGNQVTTRPDGGFSLCVPEGKWSVRPVKVERSTIVAGDFTPEASTVVVSRARTTMVEFGFRRRPDPSGGSRLMQGFEEAR
ncbi:MAG: carboxypeptidase-like regulatory domain-containing protein [Armatimonadota bacterium]